MIDHENHLLIDYGRRTYVFGLPWFTPVEDETAKKAAADTARKSFEPYDLALTRNDETPQYALTSRAHGVRSGSISAAAALSTIVEQSGWIYVLEFDDHIWICNGKNGFILPNGDRIFRDKEEAKQAFIQLEPARWKSIHIPQSWKEPGTFSDDLQRILASDEVQVSDPDDIFAVTARKWMKISGLGSAAQIAKFGAGAAAIGVAGYFGYGFLFPGYSAPEPVDLERARLMLAEQARAEIATKYEEFDSQKPWKSYPQADLFVSGCIGSMLKLPAEAAGYFVDGVSCSAEDISASYTRTAGSYTNWLQEWDRNHPKYEVDISQGGKQAFITVDAPDLAPRGDEELSNYSYVSNALQEASLIDQTKISISDPVLYTYDEYPDYVPLFGKSDISLSTNRPDAWISVFRKVPGIQIDEVTLSPKTMTYSLKGKIYVSNR